MHAHVTSADALCRTLSVCTGGHGVSSDATATFLFGACMLASFTWACASTVCKHHSSNRLYTCAPIVGVEILAHCIQPPKTCCDSDLLKLFVSDSLVHGHTRY